MPDEIVEPDWSRWLGIAILWIPMLLAVAWVNWYVLSHFPHPGGPAFRADMGEVLRQSLWLVKLQAVVNAIPFFVLGIHAFRHSSRILR